MSTRRLILTALVCGLAILVAGGVQLFRLADAERVELPGIGEARTVGGVEVVVTGVSEFDELTVVAVELSAVDDAAVGASVAEGWTLLRGTTSTPVDATPGVAGTACDQVVLAVAPVSCVVVFNPPGAGDRYLAFARGGVEARWALDA